MRPAYDELVKAMELAADNVHRAALSARHDVATTPGFDKESYYYTGRTPKDWKPHNW